MARIPAAVRAHRSAGLPYRVCLRRPTTAGVSASGGSLGPAPAGAAGALIGSLGRCGYERLSWEPSPGGVEVARNMAATGRLAAAAGIDDLAGAASRPLDVLCADRPPAVP